MSRSITGAALGAILVLASAGASAVTLVGLTSANQIVRLDPMAPNLSTPVAISGLAAGERLVGIDLRPSNGLIYGISTAQKIYTIDEFSGAASFVTALSAAVIDPARGYGIDFNPVADYNGGTSLRLVSTAGDNFAVNATTGVVGNTTSNIGAGYSAVSYTNSKPLMPPAPATTALYYIDTNTDRLRMAPGSFNAPTIMDIGALGIDVLRANGFDIAGDGRAYAALTLDDVNLASGLYGIDLATGQATLMGAYAGTLSGLTVSAVPEPGVAALMLAGLAAIGLRRRQRA
jgi:hypothetical protein